MGILSKVEELMDLMSGPLMTELPQRAKELYYYFEMREFRLPSIKQQLKDVGISSTTYYKYRKILVERELILVIKRRDLKGLFDKNLYSRGPRWNILPEI